MDRQLVVRSVSLALIIGLLWCFGLGTGYCVPASPNGATVVQPDGTKITILLRGDERAHWNEDAAGYLIMKSDATGQWVYGIEKKGVIRRTEHVVGRVDPAAVGITRPDRRALRAALTSTGRRASEIRPANYTPILTGTMLNLVVLINFADLAITNSRQEFDDLFNRIGYNADGAQGSVKDYYREVSYKQLTIQSIVVDPVTVSKGFAYYGANDANGNDHPYRVQEMVAEALGKLDGRGFDFRHVDGNGDGWIDGLTIIHAGGDEADVNDPNFIWSHKSILAAPLTFDGVSIQMYQTEAARSGPDNNPAKWTITRIGVICHETGHFLGLPDLYDTTGNSAGAGYFCLMAAGARNLDGDLPAHMSAWCKKELGWATPTVITSTGSFLVQQAETSQQQYQLQGDLPSNEYFLIENRQAVGFDAGLPAPCGILIWHVDESQEDNDDHEHYLVDLEEANGVQDLEQNTSYGDDLDYFRAGNATSFTAYTTPNSLGYNGRPSGISITNVGASGSSMSFTVSRSYALIGDDYLTPGNWWNYNAHVTMVNNQTVDVDTTTRFDVFPLQPGSGFPVLITIEDYQSWDYCTLTAEALLSHAWQDSEEAQVVRNNDPTEEYPRETYDTDNVRHFGHGQYTGWYKDNPSQTWTGYEDTYVTFLRKERVTVPAGTFDCVLAKIRTETVEDTGYMEVVEETTWFSSRFGIIKSDLVGSEYYPSAGWYNSAFSVELASSNVIKWELSVKSNAGAGVGITGSRPGTTPYTETCNDKQIVSLTAPAVFTLGAVRCDFVGWLVDGEEQAEGVQQVQVTMTADHEVTAVYQIRTQMVNVKSAPVSGLAIGGNLPGTTDYSFSTYDGSEVILTAPLQQTTGGRLVRFNRWTLDGIDQPTRVPELQLVMDAGHTAIAQYTKPVIAGDVNEDCRVNILDLIFIRGRLNLSVTTGDNWKADVTDDGRINILDLIYVRGKLNTVCP